MRWGVTAAARESITGCGVEATPLHPTNTPAPHPLSQQHQNINLRTEQNRVIIAVFGPFAVAKKLRRRQLMTNAAHVSARLIAKAVKVCVLGQETVSSLQNC